MDPSNFLARFRCSFWWEGHVLCCSICVSRGENYSCLHIILLTHWSAIAGICSQIYCAWSMLGYICSPRIVLKLAKPHSFMFETDKHYTYLYIGAEILRVATGVDHVCVFRICSQSLYLEIRLLLKCFLAVVNMYRRLTQLRYLYGWIANCVGSVETE